MDTQEARQVLKPIVAEFRAKSSAQLAEIPLDRPYVRAVVGPTGKRYQIEIGSLLDDPKHNRNLRVFVSIDDYGWRALSPLTEDFIISPDGVFIGEH